MLKQASGKPKDVLGLLSCRINITAIRYFDRIFALQVWHHITNKRKAAEECLRVLTTNLAV
ncbi:MAG: methyltransferase domain-containing protein [Candidatus Bathyarchaeia archaeon]